MIQIDGSRYSGSGTIVRQAVALAALTQQAIHITNIRTARPKPGLRAQHTWVVEAIRSLVGGNAEGNTVTSRELRFEPGRLRVGEEYTWDIGSAGSTVLLAMAVLPLLAFARRPVRVELHGGLFQDFAPSFYHLRHIVLPFLTQMGICAEAEMVRPGYVPAGGGVVRLVVRPAEGPLSPLARDAAGDVERVWGIALSSHLEHRNVSGRMSDAAREALGAEGYEAEFEVVNDTTSLQPGAALAVFADLRGGSRLGADRAGAPRRRAEMVGQHVARGLLEDVSSGATLDRHAADQMIIFAALAKGESRFRIPRLTDHVLTSAWLARELLGAETRIEGLEVRVAGVGWRPGRAALGAT